MKKIIGISFLLLLFTGCGSNGTEEANLPPDEIKTVKSEIHAIDSISDVIEKTTEDIEIATDELDNALNNL